MLERGTEITLHLDSLAFEGHAVGRHDGLVVFVRGGAPGDEIRARILKIKRRHAEAEVVEIIQPSPQRTEPRCKHFGVCGGCTWQHIAYDLQLLTKQQHVIDAFERIGNFNNLSVLPIIGAKDPYFYRNKIEFSFSRLRWLLPEEMEDGQDHIEEFGLGFHVRDRFDKVLNVEECWLQSTLSNDILNAVRDFASRRRLSIYSTKSHDGYLRHLIIRQSRRTDELMVNLVTTTDEQELMQEFSEELKSRIPEITTIVNNITDRPSMIAVGNYERVLMGSGYITETIGGLRFRISANSFFQTNTDQAERLYEVAKQLGEFTLSENVFDLYCGTGTIALYLAGSVRSIVGIDVVSSAIEDAKRNTEENKIRNCQFILGDLKDKLTKDRGWLAAEIESKSVQPDVVVLDPPRSGLHPKVVQEIAALSPKRIVYVSCNPTTQARDARMFVDLGYDLIRMQPVDMFPHTYHVENVALFKRNVP